MSERIEHLERKPPIQVPIDKVKRTKVIAKASKDLIYFSKNILGLYIPDHYREWANLVYNHDRLVVLAHRYSGKSMFFSFAYPLWRMFRGDVKEILFYTHREDEAQRVVTRWRDEIENNPWLKFLENKSSGSWGKSRFVTRPRRSNDKGIEASGKGIGSSARGRHPDLIILDDVLSDKGIYTLEYVKYYFYRVIQYMLGPRGSKMLIVGTPISYDDLYAELKENPEYVVKEYPAIDENGHILWPEFWTKEDLEKRRRADEEAFAQEFLLKPKTTQMSFFPFWAVQECLRPTMRLGELPVDVSEVESIVIGCDFAFSNRKDADYTVYTVVAQLKSAYVIIDVFRGHGLKMTDMLSILRDLYKKWNPSMIVMESTGTQISIARELESEGFPVFRVNTTRNLRIEMLSKLRYVLEKKKIKVPADVTHEFTNEYTQVLLKELWGFIQKGDLIKTVEAHDDTVFSLAFAIYYLTTQTPVITYEGPNIATSTLRSAQRQRSAIIDEDLGVIGVDLLDSSDW